MPHPLFTPVNLPNGQVLPNRIAKAAMEESMATTGQLPGPMLTNLYRTWARGGAGLLITGNVMVHDAALTGPAGVVLDKDTPLEPYRRWAGAARRASAPMPCGPSGSNRSGTRSPDAATPRGWAIVRT